MEHIPLEVWYEIFGWLSPAELLRAARCCRAWRFGICWPLLQQRRDFTVYLSGNTAAEAYNAHSALQYFCAPSLVLNTAVSPFNVLNRAGIHCALKRLTLRSIVLDESIVSLVAQHLTGLNTLIVDDCSFAGTLPGLLREPCWDLSRSGITTLVFRASVCRWNEWSVFRLIQLALSAQHSRINSLELIQPNWSRIRNMLVGLTTRRRFEFLSVGVEVPPGGIVPLESMGTPLAQAEVTHLAAKIHLAPHASDLNPCTPLCELLLASFNSLRSLDLRGSIALSDSTLAHMLFWISSQKIPLQSLAIGSRTVECDMRLTGSVLPSVSSLSHLMLENPRHLTELSLATCPAIQTLRVEGDAHELFTELVSTGRWSPILWPHTWQRVRFG